jgi:hypothetical protein
MIKKLSSPVSLIIISTLMLLGAAYISSENKAQRDKISDLEGENAILKNQVIDLKDRNYHDSTMLSEYQLGLEEFMDEDPMAAERFMKHVERAFE